MTDHNTYDAWAELKQFPWLTPVRQQIEDVVTSYEQAQHDPARAGAQQGLHMLLVAPPGLGRFRFASALGSMLFRRGHMRDRGVSVTFAKSLVSDFIGQTSLATIKTCESALHAMLLIQYPSELAGHRFAGEAVDTLTTFMDANKGQIVVVMILEPGEVPPFADLYPELVSRFHKITFPIPGASEQLGFLRQLADHQKYLLPGDLEPLLGPWIERRLQQNRSQYMREMGYLLGGATSSWIERTGAPRDSNKRYVLPDGLRLERVDFESAMKSLDGGAR